jgi:sodium-dependent dicarboxylate transporter 2/3/5
MALGELCFSTGLAAAAGGAVTGWIPRGPGGAVVLIAAATACAVVTSEFTSNVASATMVVPVAIAVGQATQGSPLAAALAATVGSTLGFMMPVSSPCNAIVYGSGRIPLRAMMAAGAILDIVGIVVITAAMTLAGRWLPS